MPGISLVHPKPHTEPQPSGCADLAQNYGDSTKAPSNHDRPVRRVLMISAAFPPTGGPGVQRSLKFAKYLPKSGWQPIVWAANPTPDLPRDASLLDDLPDTIEVHRHRQRSPLGALTRWCTSAGRSGETRDWRGGLAWRVERLLSALAWRTPPDPLIGWALGSVAKCRALIERERIDVIYSTFSPPSNHVLGWLLKRATGLPWVADFRDLWTEDYGYPHGGLRRRLDRWLERGFVTQADAVIGVTPSQTQSLAAHAGEPLEKFATITNGFDAADFENRDATEIRRRLHGPENRFVLTFTGWFLTDRVPDAVLKALTLFASEHGDAFELRIVGKVSARMRKNLIEAGVRLDATTGYVPHTQAIEHMLAADALLLLIPPGPKGQTLLPGKLFEYLASGRPILAAGATPDSEAAKIIQHHQAGICVPGDATQIRQALTELKSKQAVTPTTPESHLKHLQHLQPLTREHLTQRLASILNQVQVRKTNMPQPTT